MIQVLPLRGMPEVVEGDDLAVLIKSAIRREALDVLDRDLFVIAQKIVSKSEGRMVRLDSIDPSPRAIQWASLHDKDARMVEVVLRESKRLVRMEQGVIVSETRHGFVCANAGVDASNVEEGMVTLLPEDSDESARRLKSALEDSLKARLAVIISDTFGRPWREGLVNVAIGVAGMAPAIDYRGQNDRFGRPLRITTIATADELASAAELVMGKNSGIPVAIIRGAGYEIRPGSIKELIRPSDKNLFR